MYNMVQKLKKIDFNMYFNKKIQCNEIIFMAQNNILLDINNRLVSIENKLSLFLPVCPKCKTFKLDTLLRTCRHKCSMDSNSNCANKVYSCGSCFDAKCDLMCGQFYHECELRCCILHDIV